MSTINIYNNGELQETIEDNGIGRFTGLELKTFGKIQCDVCGSYDDFGVPGAELSYHINDEGNCDVYFTCYDCLIRKMDCHAGHNEYKDDEVKKWRNLYHRRMKKPPCNSVKDIQLACFIHTNDILILNEGMPLPEGYKKTHPACIYKHGCFHSFAGYDEEYSGQDPKPLNYLEFAKDFSYIFEPTKADTLACCEHSGSSKLCDTCLFKKI